MQHSSNDSAAALHALQTTPGKQLLSIDTLLHALV